MDGEVHAELSCLEPRPPYPQPLPGHTMVPRLNNHGFHLCAILLKCHQGQVHKRTQCKIEMQGPCPKSREKPFSFLPWSLFQSVMIFFICYLMPGFLGHRDTCRLSAGPWRCQAPCPTTHPVGHMHPTPALSSSVPRPLPLQKVEVVTEWSREIGS